MKTRVLPVVRKELREIRRDPLMLWLIVVVPLVLLFLFGSALSLDIRDVPMAVLDYDRSPASRALVDDFANTGDFRVAAHPADERAMGELLDGGRVQLALVIPPGYGRELAAGRGVAVQTVIDGSFSARAAVLRNEVEAVTTAASLRMHAASPAPMPAGIRAVPRVWYNPSLRSATFIVPGLFAVILMAIPPLLTALAVVREKENGSVQQIYVSPLRSWEFIAGKMVPYVGVALGEFLLVVAIGTWWFRVPVHGSVPLLAAGAVLYVFCTVGLGLLVSTLTRTQVGAILLSTILTVMPSFLFSGFMYPISSMPASAKLRTWLFPVRYFTDISRGVFLKGAGMAELWSNFAILALYTVIVFGLASLRFRKKIA